VGAVAVGEAHAAGETAGPLPPAAHDVPGLAQARVISAEETCASLHARLTRTEQERSEALDAAHEADARVSPPPPPPSPLSRHFAPFPPP